MCGIDRSGIRLSFSFAKSRQPVIHLTLTIFLSTNRLFEKLQNIINKSRWVAQQIEIGSNWHWMIVDQTVIS